MALRTNEILDEHQRLGETLGITGGPNDWDLWLSLRGTLNTVTFHVDRPVRLSTRNANTFLDVTFTGIALDLPASRFSSERNSFILTGDVVRVGTLFPVRMTYNTQTRKGSLVFI